MKPRKVLQNETNTDALTVLVGEIGAYLWERTKKDWVLTISHIPTEPVCPTVHLVEEMSGTGVKGVYGDTIEGAVREAYRLIRIKLDG